MGQSHHNIHGRKPGRGLRPWVLIPKVLFVGSFFGGSVAAAVVWGRGWPALRAAEADPAAALAVVNLVGDLFRWLIVPAVVLAMAAGVVLVLLVGRLMLRQRWLQVKLAALAAAVPVLHLVMASRLHALRTALEAGRTDEAAVWQFTAGLGVMLAGSAAIIFLGRHKPRLGQNWAKAFRVGRG